MEEDITRLKIHSKPDLNFEIVCEVKYMAEFILGPGESTDDFYKVYTSFGADGYCSREEFIEFSKGGSVWKVS